MASVSTLSMHSVRKLVGLATLMVLAVVLGGCGGGAGGSSSAPIPSTFISNQPNAVQLTVDNGPANYTGPPNVNRLFTSVTVCESGTTHCKLIDHVLVDTGSTGLRILNAALVGPTLNLSPVTVAGGQPLLSCVQFADRSYAFGPVVTADVTLGPQTASNLPIQIMASPTYATLLPNCATGFTAINTVNDLGANGILGVGLYAQDCGSFCTVISANDYYYTCAPGNCTIASGATGTTATLAQQLTNPITRFGADSNGVVIDLPFVPAPGTTSIIGQMLFGVGTQANNATTGTTPLRLNGLGNIKTVLTPGSTYNKSFIDSGSNGLFFGPKPDPTNPTIPTIFTVCGDFYCPSGNPSVHATLSGANGINAPFTFVVGYASNLFSNGYSVLPTLTGPMGDTTTFDWGLPFFYGRRVFFGIEGRSTPLGTGPLIAF